MRKFVPVNPLVEYTLRMLFVKTYFSVNPYQVGLMTRLSGSLSHVLEPYLDNLDMSYHDHKQLLIAVSLIASYSQLRNMSHHS